MRAAAVVLVAALTHAARSEMRENNKYFNYVPAKYVIIEHLNSTAAAPEDRFMNAVSACVHGRPAHKGLCASASA